MNCDKVRRLLSSYIDDQLSERDKQRVQGHLERCESCRAELFDLRQSVAALDAIPSDDPGPEFNEAVARRLQERREAIERKAMVWLRPALGLACLLAIAVLAIPIYVANMEHFVGRQDIYVIGGDTLIPGSHASIRVVVANRGADNPVPLANVNLALVPEQGRGRTQLLSGRTDAAGTLEGRFLVPASMSGDASLVVTSRSWLGSDTISVPVKLQRVAKVLLTTDKPIYQPGQIVHVRALALLRPSLKPAGGADIRFTIEDPHGNKVFDETVPASKWGIAAAEFQLGDELNLGRYEIKAKLDETETTKTVTVKRYVLPKFKVDLETDRTYYLPGRTIRGTVSANYFFGKPVAGARVQITLSDLAVRLEKYAEITGRTDAGGSFSFEAKAPDFLAGQPAAGGNGLVKIGVRVVDSAEHGEEIVRTLPVAKSAIRIAVVPESGEFAPGLENVVYIVTSYPDGRPARTQTSLVFAGRKQTAQSDTLGISAFTIEPPKEAFEIRVAARDSGGQSVSERINFSPASSRLTDEQRWVLSAAEVPTRESMGSLLVRADKALYDVGDTAKIVIVTTAEKGAVYLDAVLDSQTVLTKTLPVTNGRAELELDLSEDYAGTLTFHAYMVSITGVPVGDTATVLVRPTGELNVAVDSDRETYRPGGKARLLFRVTDRGGAGVPAAIGVNIVDESVFSVEEQMPGLAALYFALQEEILKPRYQTKFAMDEDTYRLVYREPERARRMVEQHIFQPRLQSRGELPGWNDPNSVLINRPSESVQRAARILFASAVAAADTEVCAVTQAAKDEMVEQVRYRFLGHSDQAGLRWFILIVFLLTIVPAAVSAYRGRLRFALAGVVLTLGMAVVYLATALAGASKPWGAEVSAVDAVCGISGFLAIVLWAISIVVALRDVAAWYEIAAGLVFFALVVAILFPVFARAGCAARGGSSIGAALRAQALDVAEPQIGGSASGQPVHVRQFFPETLYSNPAVITDESGRGSVELTVADSITTWRVSALASSMNGQVGSATAGLRVFQDFFVDLDLPVGVTQDDVISVPVAVYNYLPSAQSVTLKLRPGTWFELRGGSVQTKTLGANEVSVVYFPIKAARLGRHSLTVEAQSGQLADAIRRELTVYPNGKRETSVASGAVFDDVRASVHIPRGAIPGASKLLVKLYPGVFSQVVEGLEGLLQVPFGCFEQTSSITYPNVLILKYLDATEKNRPEIRMKAEQYISLGYQRLLTFEVRSTGGFDWFGHAPANTVLSAYGVMELSDMAGVATVDRRLIDRAKQLLDKRQNADGSWDPDRHTHTWGSLNDELPITAYVTWALAEGGFETSEAVKSACGYLEKRIERARDPYVLALIANALVASGEDAAARPALDRLARLAQVRKNRARWTSRTNTLTYGEGGVASTETTALAAYAFVKSHTHSSLAEQALAEITATRDPRGSWGTTQATILALKVLLAGSTEGVGGSGDVKVVVNGTRAGTVRFTGDDTDIMHAVDVTHLAQAGTNTVELVPSGDARPAYQVVASYYIPWSKVRSQDVGEMKIDVRYGKLRVSRGGVVDVAATVRANRDPVKMAIVDLGIPPGFGVVADDLEALRSKRMIDRFEITPRQLILYLRDLKPGKAVAIRYSLRALYPVRATAPASVTYDYYNPTTRRSVETPVKLEIL